MTSPLRMTVLTTLCLLVLPLLVACGGDDDNDGASPTNTAMVVAASPTTTAAPDADDNVANDSASPTTDSESSTASASPTGGATASPTRDASRPVATRAPEPTPTESDVGTGSDTDPVTPGEQALLGILLEQADLPDGWTVESAEGVADDPDSDDQICGAESFPQQDQKIAEVEGEYSFDSVDAPLFLLQNLVQFPEDIALDAMDWAREASSCTEWTDDQGSTIQVAPLESPALGDDSHAVRFAFEAGDGTIVEGDWVFIRVGGMISTIAYLGQQGSDLAQFYDIMVTATEKMESGSGDSGTGPDVDPEVQVILLDMLLAQNEVPAE